MKKRKSLTQTHTKHSRGNKRSETDTLRIKSDIISLSENHTDQEIMDILKINNETYYRYKSIINREAKEIWTQQFKEGVELRILHTVNSINLSLKINKEIATNTNNSAKDRLDAAERLVETEMGLLELLRSLRDDNNVQQQEQTKRDYPTITVTDPAWIQENIKKMKEQSNLTECGDYSA
jgi:hypothetical protein